MSLKIRSLLLILVFGLISTVCFSTYAQEQANADEIQSKINEYTQKLNELGKAKDTLANQIKILDSQISLTLLKINQTETLVKNLEKEISELSLRIGQLDIDLNQLSEQLINQIVENYKLNKRIPSLSIFTSQNFNSFYHQYRYASQIQKNNQNTLLSLETVRTNYDIQKSEKIKKQKELEILQKKLKDQKSSLARQKDSKNNLLAVTQNDEKKYQELLNKARAELAAIEAIIAGLGVETKVGEVQSGAKIATIIEGKSCSSSGTHLHFMVKTNSGVVQNPLNYLKKTDFIDRSGGDPFNPSGSWDWPIKSPINFNQGYGKTWAVQNEWVGRIYSFHTGIDISGPSIDVTSPIKGTLYRGSYQIKSQNCVLKYVRIENKELGVDTLNLHVNYF